MTTEHPVERAIEAFASIHTPDAERIAALEQEISDLRANEKYRFAKAVGVTYDAVRHWLSGETGIAIKHWARIEELTNGQVTQADFLAFEQRRIRENEARKAS